MGDTATAAPVPPVWPSGISITGSSPSAPSSPGRRPGSTSPMTSERTSPCPGDGAARTIPATSGGPPGGRRLPARGARRGVVPRRCDTRGDLGGQHALGPAPPLHPREDLPRLRAVAELATTARRRLRSSASTRSRTRTRRRRSSASSRISSRCSTRRTGTRVILGSDLNMDLTTSNQYYVERGGRHRRRGAAARPVDAIEVTDHRRPSGPTPARQGGTCRHLVRGGLGAGRRVRAPSLVGQVRAIRSTRRRSIAGLSDDATLDLDLDAHARVAEEWSPETFAAPRPGAVMAARDGDSRHLRSLRWAEETASAPPGPRHPGVDPRAPRHHARTRPAVVQIDYRGPFPAVMYSIAIRARGDVVVRFQLMRRHRRHAGHAEAARSHDDVVGADSSLGGVDQPGRRCAGGPIFRSTPASSTRTGAAMWCAAYPATRATSSSRGM